MSGAAGVFELYQHSWLWFRPHVAAEAEGDERDHNRGKNCIAELSDGRALMVHRNTSAVSLGLSLEWEKHSKSGKFLNLNPQCQNSSPHPFIILKRSFERFYDMKGKRAGHRAVNVENSNWLWFSHRFTESFRAKRGIPRDEILRLRLRMTGYGHG